MANQTTKEIPEVILTPRVLVFGVAASIITAILGMYMTAFAMPGSWIRWFTDPLGGWASFMTMMLFYIAVTTIFTLIARKFKIRPKKYVLLYCMIGLSTLFANGNGYPGILTAMIAQWRLAPGNAIYEPLFPSWLPPARALEPMKIGGAPVPWDIWILPMIIIIPAYLIVFFLYQGIASVFRRLWLDIERMEFPPAVVTSMAIQVAINPYSNVSRLKRYLIAFVLGFVFYLFFWLNILFPWIPSLTTAWFKPPFVSIHMGAFDLAQAIPGLFDLQFPIGLNLNPVYTAIFLAAPLDMLLSASVGMFLVGSLIPCIEVWIGHLPHYPAPGPAAGGSGNIHSRWVDSFEAHGTAFTNTGMLLALAILPFIFGKRWKYITETLRYAIKGGSPKEEENEAMSYRTGWTMIIVSLIALILWTVFVWNVQLHITLFLILMLIATELVAIRVRGVVGAPTRTFHDAWAGVPATIRYMFPDVAALPAPASERIAMLPNATVQSYYMGARWSGMFIDMHLGGTMTFAGNIMVENYRLAGMFDIKPKEVWRASLIASLAVFFISMPFSIWLFYTYGIKGQGLAVQWGYGPGMSGAWDPSGWLTSIGPVETVMPSFYIWTTAGFIVMAALIWLRANFVWWPIHPAGFFAGIAFYHPHVFYYTWLLAWFIKWLVFRIGGIKAYNEWVLPICAGILVGYALSIALWDFAAIYKSFV
jgi:hypothetical protein